MALRLVLLQNGFGLQIQRFVQPFQTLGQVLVYGGFADSKLLCSGSDSGFLFYNVLRYVRGTLLDVRFQKHHSKQILVKRKTLSCNYMPAAI